MSGKGKAFTKNYEMFMSNFWKPTIFLKSLVIAEYAYFIQEEILLHFFLLKEFSISFNNFPKEQF